MCGIAGMLNCNDAMSCENADYLRSAEQMRDSLKRRGPDQDGIYTGENVTLIHTRLAVIDIENGLQPMVFTGGDCEYALVYNGELYNTDEIRAELLAKGHEFSGHSDTEVVLKSYVQWGEDCVHKFNGIFAFAVWKSADKSLFFARDRMGVKPFFYAVRGDQFIFSSEIKGILQHPLVKPEIDAQSVAEIMLVGPGRTPGYGIFKDIEELPAGCCGRFRDYSLKIRQYWDVQDKETNDTFEETLEKVKFLVTDAIRLQTVSDVPVCTFLSGGLDSSIIAAVTAEEFKKQGRELHTFSVDYYDNDKYFKASKFQPSSDDYYIRKMSEHIGSTHHFVRVDTPELVDSLFKAVDARDLPAMADVDGSLLLFCNEVKKHCTVALSGECADESGFTG